MKRVALLAAMAIAQGSAFAAGDPEKGQALHRVCEQCHGTGPYQPGKAKVKSLAALRREVARWGDYYNPALSKRDVDDLVAYLNRDFYRFPEK
ncbi:MAG: c-type cytochrome [Bacteroidota bacterium]